MQGGARARTIVVLVALVALLVPAPLAAAQGGDSVAEAPTITLVVAAANPEGSASLFGHSYLLVQRPGQTQSAAYTYQIYKSDTDWSGLPSASIGRAVMDLQRVDATYLQDRYVDEGREIRHTPLLLAPDEAWALADQLRTASDDEGILPYHMIENNCSTRLRDFIDQALEGQLANATDHMSGNSVRTLGIPYIEHQTVSAQLWMFLYGSTGDRELSVWEETFIPRELERILQEVRLDDGRDIAGTTTVAVPGTLEAPGVALGPDAVKAVAAVIIAAVMLGAGLAVRRWPVVASRTFGTLLTFFGLIIGVVSTFILFAWNGGMGSHLSHNQNILIASPLGWALIPLGVTIWTVRQRTWRWLFGVSAASLVLLFVAVVVRLLPGVPAQYNLPAIGVAALFWAGIAGIAVWGARSTPLAHAKERLDRWTQRAD